MEEGPPYRLEFYRSPDGSAPVRDWIREELTRHQRRELGVAMRFVLQRLGVGVCGTEFGRALGEGLFEFRLRRAQPELLLRIFCHAHGDRIVLLLGGYDKGSDPVRDGSSARSRSPGGAWRSFEWRDRRDEVDVVMGWNP